MRAGAALLVGLAWAALALAQAEPEKRYGLEAELDTFPQGTAKETLASVLKAVSDKRISYLLANLADPEWVDQRVQANPQGFQGVVDEVAAKLAQDSAEVKQLRRFERQGEWEEGSDTASVRLKDVRERVFFRKIGKRWFLENRKTSPANAP